MGYRARTLLIVFALGPMVLAQEIRDPGEALYGEWEVVEMVLKGKVQDFNGKSGGWFVFEPGALLFVSDEDRQKNVFAEKWMKKLRTNPCTIRPNEFDSQIKLLGQPLGKPVKASYAIKDGQLRIVWREHGGERPTDFDEAYKDPQLALYILKKVK